MNRNLKSRVPDPRAGFDPSHHASHRTLGGLTRCPDLKDLMENDRAPVMKRNAVIALANIGTVEAMDVLRQYRDIEAGEIGEYIAWAIDRVAGELSEAKAGGGGLHTDGPNIREPGAWPL